MSVRELTPFMCREEAEEEVVSVEDVVGGGQACAGCGTVHK
jgi:hypothetical protein